MTTHSYEHLWESITSKDVAEDHTAFRELIDDDDEFACLIGEADEMYYSASITSDDSDYEPEGFETVDPSASDYYEFDDIVHDIPDSCAELLISTIIASIKFESDDQYHYILDANLPITHNNNSHGVKFSNSHTMVVTSSSKPRTSPLQNAKVTYPLRSCMKVKVNPNYKEEKLASIKQSKISPREFMIRLDAEEFRVSKRSADLSAYEERCEQVKRYNLESIFETKY